MPELLACTIGVTAALSQYLPDLSPIALPICPMARDLCPPRHSLMRNPARSAAPHRITPRDDAVDQFSHRKMQRFQPVAGRGLLMRGGGVP